MLDQRGFRLHRFEVGELKPYLLSGALASGLLAGLLVASTVTALLPKASKACTRTKRNPLP